MGRDTIKVRPGEDSILRVTAAKRPKVNTPLLAWMQAKGVSVNDIAIATGCTPVSITLWKFGRCVPDLVPAFLIERLTKGDVPVASWLAIPPARAQWANYDAKRELRTAGHFDRKKGR